jgi:hypothetical protein
VRRILLTAFLVGSVLSNSALAAAPIDYPDTVFASIDSAAIRSTLVSGAQIDFEVDLQIRRNHNSVNYITAQLWSDLPSKTAFEAPYECQVVTFSVGGISNPDTGRPASFISEASTGDRVLEHHILKGSLHRDSLKTTFCAGSISLTLVEISDSAKHTVSYREGRTQSFGKKGDWYAYSDLWYANPKIAPCTKISEIYNFYTPCLNGDLTTATTSISQGDVDAATKREAEKKILDDKELQEVTRLKQELALRLETLEIKLPRVQPLIRVLKIILNTISLRPDTLEEGKNKIFEISHQLDLIERSSAPKIISITCVKGKLIKKVTAVNPACPAGYKKK